MPSGEEIARATRAFADRWRGYDQSERSEAQTFLNELLACYGIDRYAAGVLFEDARVSDGIVDMHWPGRCIVEMKSPREAMHLDRHREQALHYWTHSASVAAGRPAPRYVVLCAFSRFEVWEPGQFPREPCAVFSLDELPDGYEALLFLAGGAETPIFSRRRALTERAVDTVARLYERLVDRKAETNETLRWFVLQSVWCLFAENVGLIEGRPFRRIATDLHADPRRSSAAELGHLFAELNREVTYLRKGVYAVPYVNGGLFDNPARVDLDTDELALLLETATFDWSEIEPSILGALMEKFLGGKVRREIGVHYTHEPDILKIVRPTIVEPWQRQIHRTRTVEQAERVLARLSQFRVLDPACGCGTFLNAAYRDLRRLERAASERIDELAWEAGLPTRQDERPQYPLDNLYGIDFNPFVVMIARMTLWMGHTLAAIELDSPRPRLPLPRLSSIRVDDALSVPWPDVDAIIGNPPFLGSQHLRTTFDPAYVEWLKSTFDCGLKDYCVYWFRKTQDHLRPGGRAGLVGTNSIAQNRARSASLDYVVANGGVIVDAVSSQKWPGDAAVHVSIVNWVKSPAQPPERFLLDGVEVPGITAELRPPGRSTGHVARLGANAGRCFQGFIPAGRGFLLLDEDAAALLDRTDADYRAVVRPFLTGEDITDRPDQRPGRWTIDFGLMPLEAAMRYPAALRVVERLVMPVREKNNRAAYRQRWWLFGENRPGLRAAVAGLQRVVVGNQVGKRPLFAWYDPWVCPNSKTNVFAFDDDYAMGVLTSRPHVAWAWSRGATLKADVSYTPTTVFETFPWPEPAEDQRERIAAASREVMALRQEACRAGDIGLTTLYNRMDKGAYVEIAAAHRELDEAVAAAYGWPAAVDRDDDEIVRRLLALNRAITAGERPYDPFGPADEMHLAFDL